MRVVVGTFGLPCGPWRLVYDTVNNLTLNLEILAELKIHVEVTH